MSKEYANFPRLLKGEMIAVGAMITSEPERTQRIVNLGAAFGALVEVLADSPHDTRGVIIKKISRKIQEIEQKPLFSDPTSSFLVEEVEKVTGFLRAIQDCLVTSESLKG